MNTTPTIPLYRAIALAMPTEPARRERLLDALLSFLPRTSGINAQPEIEPIAKANSYRFVVPHHHMDKAGGYVGWNYSLVRVWPSLARGFTLTVQSPHLPKGVDRAAFIDYLLDSYHRALWQPVDWQAVVAKLREEEEG